MLVATTLMWGLSFPLMKNWQQAAHSCPGGEIVSSLTLIALRGGLALILLAALRPRLVLAPSWRAYRAGMAIGTAYLLGSILQVVGLAWTTPALSVFITSLGSAWVPILALFAFRLSVAPATWLGLLLGIAGAAALGLHHEGAWQMGWGETLTLVSSVIFACQVLLLDRLGRSVESTDLTIGFLGITVVPSVLLATVWVLPGPGVLAWMHWLAAMLCDLANLRDIILLTLFPTVLALLWMNRYQPQVSAGRAALIYFLEPVFGAAFSILWGHDQLTPRLLLGGSLILGGNLLVELPIWLRDYRQRRAANRSFEGDQPVAFGAEAAHRKAPPD